MSGPEHAQSFNADGPTVTAFETVGLDQREIPAFGVAVYATQCGVNGVAFADFSQEPANPHRIAPELVGVHGRGDNEGVQGEGPIGVHGIGLPTPGLVSNQGVGVLGEGDFEGVEGRGQTGVAGRGVMTGVDGTGRVGVHGKGATAGGGTGVLGEGPIGVEGSGPIGVHGIGGSLDGQVAARMGVLGEGGLIGVEGRNIDGMGILGASVNNRGGVFQTGGAPAPALQSYQSKPCAQVLLVPVHVVGDIEGHLPRAGHIGDLLAITSQHVDPIQRRAVTTTELWFCTSSGSNDHAQSGAVWAKLQFEKTVTVP
jgi:hypothetical protein